MIDGEFLRGECDVAILATKIIAKEYILPIQPHLVSKNWFHISFKLNDTRQAKGILSATNTLRVILKNLNLVLKPEDNRFFPINHFDWFIA